MTKISWKDELANFILALTVIVLLEWFITSNKNSDAELSSIFLSVLWKVALIGLIRVIYLSVKKDY